MPSRARFSLLVFRYTDPLPPPPRRSRGRFDGRTDGGHPLCRPTGLSFKAVAAGLRNHAGADSRNLGAAVLFAPKSLSGRGATDRLSLFRSIRFESALTAGVVGARARGPS